jgi:hypothetical protein
MVFRCQSCQVRFKHTYDIVVMGARQEPSCPKCRLAWWVVREDA